MSESGRPLLPRAGERIPVRLFMERALYDPEEGYYTARISGIGGPAADFATSASLDPGFAEALTRWIRHEIAGTGRKLRGGDGLWHVIELGGGSGHLARGILHSLGWGGRRRVALHIVEISQRLQETQRRTLGRRAGSVTWHPTIADALRRAGGRAIVFSNEFADAFPATVVQWDAESNAWHEVWLEGRHANRFAEVLLPLAPEASDSVVFDRERWNPVPLRDGQRCEVLHTWRDWLAGWIGEADAVAMMTIDYGDTFPSLYRGRPEGTLRAYRQHQRFAGTEVYAHPGRQDLTTDVNFTDLQLWAEHAGMTTVASMAQREFLHRYGGNPATAAAGFLRDPCGAGEAFRVLCQRNF